MPAWAYSEQDGVGDDDLPQLADAYRSGGTHQHADMSQEIYDQLLRQFQTDNWLARGNNIADLTAPVQETVHQGVDTTTRNAPSRPDYKPVTHDTWTPYQIEPVPQPEVKVDQHGEYDRVKFIQTGAVISQRNVRRARNEIDFHHQYQAMRQGPTPTIRTAPVKNNVPNPAPKPAVEVAPRTGTTVA